MKPLQVDVDDLVGRAEIAKRARIKLATVDTWRRRYPTFPEPLMVISGTPIWFWPTVETWIDETPREVGRPPDDYHAIARTPLPDRLAHVIRNPAPIDPLADEGKTA